MDHHNKDNPKNKGDSLMIPVTGLPETLEDYIDFIGVLECYDEQVADEEPPPEETGPRDISPKAK